MHIKMNTGLSGPLYCLAPNDEIPFDGDFPLTGGELGRHLEAGNCTYFGKQEDLDAWLAANPDPDPVIEMPPLFGSSILPAIVEIDGFELQLGGIVSAAFTAFAEALPGSTTEAEAHEAWNGLRVIERELQLDAIVEQLKANPDTIVDRIAATSIVKRPTETPAAEPAPAVDSAAAAPNATERPGDDVAAPAPADEVVAPAETKPAAKKPAPKRA